MSDPTCIPHHPSELSASSPPLVWAFIPFWIEQNSLVGDSYDTADFKVELAQTFQQLGLPWVWQPIVHGNLDRIIAQVVASGRSRPVVVFNFCDGVDDPNESPGLSVVSALERSGVPFTGANAEFFRISTSKIRMKQLFQEAGVPTAPFCVLPNAAPPDMPSGDFDWPLFCKPDVSAASYGISLRSVVHSLSELLAYRDELKSGRFAKYFATATFIAERYIEGREFTLFVGGEHHQPDSLWSLPPVERIFHPDIPPAERFLSFDRYWGHYQEESAPPDGKAFYHYQPAPAALHSTLETIGKLAYCAVRGHGYGRIDIRQDHRSGRLHVLEVNANCGLSGDDQTSLGNILHFAGLSFPDLIGTIISKTMSSFDRPQAG
ncbi:hypothetical protein [Propionivibrio dicarboxylicus]|uniref:D-alanine-D-alanine ligase n=1 Tax=Propionivibrio dicarboxylicus TaxID=83767 RepID=A0A1G8J0N2_9RHOO|nr:hypothetical protein [Propionivibrio dicarboxylicus]SDI24632.1 D-alanine-D-alanine ligase [Propionivibrio dicarboxylicus]